MEHYGYLYRFNGTARSKVWNTTVTCTGLMEQIGLNYGTQGHLYRFNETARSKVWNTTVTCTGLMEQLGVKFGTQRLPVQVSWNS